MYNEWDKKEFEGPVASVYLIDTTSIPRDTNSADLVTWLMYAPGAHPHWDYHVLTVVHLRDQEGQTIPPHRDSPDATHELLVLAVNPEIGITGADSFLEYLCRTAKGLPWWLVPPDVRAQAKGVTDEQMVRLAHLLARGVSDGLLVPDSDHRQHWRDAIDSTLQHIVHGGHPTDPSLN